MQAIDVMTTNVVTATPETSIHDIARAMLENRISAVPIVDQDQRVLGIVSEGDLMRRPENETERRHSWWLDAFSGPDRAEDYIRSHGSTAAEVMTRNVIQVDEHASIQDIAQLLEKHRIKRVPVTRDGRLVGIVSRANLLHGLIAKPAEITGANASDDRTVREALMRTLADEVGLNTAMIIVIVTDGVVQLWGAVHSTTEGKAAELAARNTAGVKAVENHLGKALAWTV
jgi:CBS domain-containing protein